MAYGTFTPHTHHMLAVTGHFSCLPILDARQKDEPSSQERDEKQSWQKHTLAVHASAHRVSHVCSHASGQSKSNVHVQGQQWVAHPKMPVKPLPHRKVWR